MASNLPSEPAGPTLDAIEVDIANRSVLARSRRRLQFEPRGEMRAWRNDLAEAVRGLESRRGEVLHAIYRSSVREPCDVENVLLYNVGPGAFSASAHDGLRFERDFRDVDDPHARHEHRYLVTPAGAGFRIWRPTTPIVTIGPVDLGTVRAPLTTARCGPRWHAAASSSTGALRTSSSH